MIKFNGIYKFLNFQIYSKYQHMNFKYHICISSSLKYYFYPNQTNPVESLKYTKY